MSLSVKSARLAFEPAAVALPDGTPAIWPGTTVTVTDIVLNATTGGKTVEWRDLSEAELRIDAPIAGLVQSPTTTFTIPMDVQAGGAPVQVTLYACRKGDAMPTSGLLIQPFPALQPFASYLGDAYGKVPNSWLNAHFGAQTLADFQAAEGDADGDGLLNWEEYVAGTDPKNAKDTFRITAFSIDADGNPVIEWEPKFPNRNRYVTEGAETLGGPWGEPTHASRFFRVKADLKN